MYVYRKNAVIKYKRQTTEAKKAKENTHIQKNI